MNGRRWNLVLALIAAGTAIVWFGLQHTGGESVNELAEAPVSRSGVGKMKAEADAVRRGAPDERSRARDEQVLKLKASGPGSMATMAYLEDVRREWLEIENVAHLGAEFGAWQCFALGCFTTVTFPNVDALDRFSLLVRAAKLSNGWRGMAYRSGPIGSPGGRTQATWIFFEPASAERPSGRGVGGDVQDF